MRIRTIKPDFWEHPVMSRQSDIAQLLAIGLLNLADDEGYFYADPKIVRNHLRQRDEDSMNTHGALMELSRIGYISIREHSTHGPIGKIESFAAHQVISRPTASKIKELYDSMSAHGGLMEDSLPERKGKERKGTGNTPLPPEGESGERRPTLEEAKSYASQIGITEQTAIAWWQTRDSSQWMKGTAGGGKTKVGSWQSDMSVSRGWAEEIAAKNKPKKNGEYKSNL